MTKRRLERLLARHPLNDRLRRQYARLVFKELHKQNRELLDTRSQK